MHYFMDSYGSIRSHTLVPQWYRVLSFKTIRLFSSSRIVFSFFAVRVGPKRRRWRLITTQSPLPVRPTPTRSQKAATAFCRLGRPTPHRYRCNKTNNLHSQLRGKKEETILSLPWPSSPFAALFLQITGGPIDRMPDYRRPGNPSREWRRFSFERTDRQTTNVRIKRPSEQSSETRHWPECRSLGEGTMPG